MKHVKMSKDARGPQGQTLTAGAAVTVEAHTAAALVEAGAAAYCGPDGQPLPGPTPTTTTTEEPADEPGP